MTAKLAPAAQRVEPTSLLILVAGEFASRVAAVWPAPHEAFVTAPAARRHLVCLALTAGRDAAALADVLLDMRLRRAVRLALRDAPDGVERALTRMGDVAWPAADYRKLLLLLAEPRAAKVLRHAHAIDVGLVRRLAELPAAMAQATPLALDLPEPAMFALRETYAAIRFRAGAAAADAAARRWARAGSTKALLEAVRDDLYPEPPAPPHAGTARLRPLASKAALRDAARRYRNCLRTQTPYATAGWAAYYEWEGPPDAVVEIVRDAITGWRLEQARLADNMAVPEALRDEIISELALMGVQVGRSCWELDRALAGVEGDTFVLRPLEDVVADAFG